MAEALNNGVVQAAAVPEAENITFEVSPFEVFLWSF